MSIIFNSRRAFRSEDTLIYVLIDPPLDAQRFERAAPAQA